MSMAFILIKRNIKLFFKDKGMFFTSLITPAILLVLYVTFLGNVYHQVSHMAELCHINIKRKLRRHIRCPVPFLPCGVIRFNLGGFGIVLADFFGGKINAVLIKYL